MPYYFSLLFQILVIYFTSRSVTQQMYILFHKTTKSTSVSHYLLAAMYFPGTVIHELAHFGMAVLMMLNVHELNLFPNIKKLEDGRYYIKLGSVVFEHKDHIRSLIVGIAPLFVGMIFFYFLGESDIFPNENFLLNIFFIYIIFSVSSSMFSSKKDLESMIIIVPLFLLIMSLLLGFKVDLGSTFSKLFLGERVLGVISKLNYYLLFSTVINVAVFLILKILHGHVLKRNGSM